MKKTSFSPVCDACANEMDRLTIAKDYDALASYVLQQEDEYASNNDFECAPIFFYIGTGNSTLAHHYHRSSSDNEQEITYRKKALFGTIKAQALSNQIGVVLVFIIMRWIRPDEALLGLRTRK